MSDARLNPDGTFNIEKPAPFADQLAERYAQQATMPREQIKQQMIEESEVAEDLDELVERGRSRTHNWHSHGLKMMCYDAGHPPHEVWRRPAKR